MNELTVVTLIMVKSPRERVQPTVMAGSTPFRHGDLKKIGRLSDQRCTHTVLVFTNSKIPCRDSSRP